MNGQDTKSLWADAFSRLVRDRSALLALVVVSFYALLALLATLNIGVPDWH